MSGAAGLKPCAQGPGEMDFVHRGWQRHNQRSISGQSAVNAKIPIAISKWFMLE